MSDPGVETQRTTPHTLRASSVQCTSRVSDDEDYDFEELSVS